MAARSSDRLLSFFILRKRDLGDVALYFRQICTGLLHIGAQSNRIQRGAGLKHRRSRPLSGSIGHLQKDSQYARVLRESILNESQTRRPKTTAINKSVYPVVQTLVDRCITAMWR